jgi:hypothetical protein
MQNHLSDSVSKDRIRRSQIPVGAPEEKARNNDEHYRNNEDGVFSLFLRQLKGSRGVPPGPSIQLRYFQVRRAA